MGEPSADKQAQVLLERGASLYEEGKLYEALSCWKQVLQIDPGNEIAAEYLRFIEDNFQIGVDAFIEYHTRQDEAPDGPPAEPPTPTPVVEDVQELDWSEVLDEGPDGPSPRPAAETTPPPLPPEAMGNGVAEPYFEELADGSLDAAPGEEAAAWGADEGEPSFVAGTPVTPGASVVEPAEDPLSLPVTHFAASYHPPVSAEHGSISREILPGKGRRRTSAMDVLKGRRSVPRARRVASPPPVEPLALEPTPILPAATAPLDLEPGGPDAGGHELGDLDVGGLDLGEDADLEAILAKGLADLGAFSEEPAAALPVAPASDREAPVPAKPVGDLEAMVRGALADLEVIESRGAGQGGSSRAAEPELPPDADLGAIMEQVRRRRQVDDFSGALALLERVLAADPNHREALAFVDQNKARLAAMYRSKLGKLDRRPRVRMKPHEILWLSLDHRAGFLIDQVDGRTSYQEIIDISGLPELEVTRILATLVGQGVIG